MTSNAALVGREGGTRTVEAGVLPACPARHLRVLPPAPRAYAAAAPSGVRRAGLRHDASAVSRHPARTAGAAPLRLTARGRRLVVVLLLLLAVGVVAVAEAVLGSGGTGLELMGTASVVVEPGDTLWSIARDVVGERDVREVVDVIQLLNGLDDAAIEPGQVLQLP